MQRLECTIGYAITLSETYGLALIRAFTAANKLINLSKPNVLLGLILWLTLLKVFSIILVVLGIIYAKKVFQRRNSFNRRFKLLVYIYCYMLSYSTIKGISHNFIKGRAG